MFPAKVYQRYEGILLNPRVVEFESVFRGRDVKHLLEENGELVRDDLRPDPKAISTQIKTKESAIKNQSNLLAIP